MIVNLERFIARERPNWDRLDAMLARIAEDPWRTMPVEEARELERLYRRAASDLARLATFTAERDVRRYLENIVGRGYTEIHGGAAETGRFRPGTWLTQTFPRTWRRRAAAFWLAAALTMAGVLFGGRRPPWTPRRSPC